MEPAVRGRAPRASRQRFYYKSTFLSSSNRQHNSSITMTRILLAASFTLTLLTTVVRAQVASPAIPPNVLQEQFGLNADAGNCEKAVSQSPIIKVYYHASNNCDSAQNFNPIFPTKFSSPNQEISPFGMRNNKLLQLVASSPHLHRML